MRNLIPFVSRNETKMIKSEIKGRNVLIIFDGTTRLDEAVAIIVRYVVDTDLIRPQLQVKSTTGEEIAREIVNTLSVEYVISTKRVLASIRDTASSNEVAIRRTIKVDYPDTLDVGCFSHSIDHVGKIFHMPTLEDFMRLWISLFAYSPHSYSETHWWSRWEVCN